MSNPGVIILDNTELNNHEINGSRLQIEDNIGEAIHIHLGDLRLDFTIHDFLVFAEGMEIALENLLFDINVDLDYLDPLFFREIEDHIKYISGYELKEIYLDDLKCIETDHKKLKGWELCRVEKTKAYNYLIKNHDKRNRTSQWEEDNSAIDDIMLSIENNGYPYNNKYITLLGDDLIVRDGKKRAAYLRYKNGNIKVPVLFIKFNTGYSKYNLSKKIYVRSLIKYYLKLILPYRMRLILRKYLWWNRR